MSSKKNTVAIIGVAVSIIILLFGNNILGRLFKSNPDVNIQDNKEALAESDSNFLNFDRQADKKLPKRINEATEDSIAEDFLSDDYPNILDQVLEHKDYDRALRILEVASKKTLQKRLISKIENRRKSILLMMEKGFDDVYFSFPADVVLTIKDKKQGIYSRDGRELIPPKYEDIDPLNFFPLLLTKLVGKYGFLDSTGKEIFPPIFTEVEPHYFYPLFLVKENGNYGFISQQGEIVVEPKFSSVWGKDNELIMVKEFNKWGFIDTFGNEVIKIMYDTIAEFDENGVAFARLKGSNLFIDRKGQRVKNPAFK